MVGFTLILWLYNRWLVQLVKCLCSNTCLVFRLLNQRVAALFRPVNVFYLIAFIFYICFYIYVYIVFYFYFAALECSLLSLYCFILVFFLYIYIVFYIFILYFYIVLFLLLFSTDRSTVALELLFWKSSVEMSGTESCKSTGSLCLVICVSLPRNR